MPEIDSDRLAAKLREIPEGAREPYLRQLREKGYTWRSKPEAPPAEDTVLEAARRNFLTNKPTDWAGKIARSSPATLGAGFGAVAGAPAGPLGSLAGAYVGGTAGEGMRQLAVNIENWRKGDEYTPAAESLGEISGEATNQAAGQAAGMAAFSPTMVENVYTPAYNAVRGKVAPMIRSLAGIPEAITEWAMKRGPKEILTAEKAAPESALNALDALREAVIGQKKAAGKALGAVEEAYLASPESKTLFDTSGPAAGIRKELKRPIFDPVVGEYGGAAAEKGYLEKLAGDLESGPASGRQVMGLRKNLDKVPEWQGSPIPNPSTDLDRVVKGVNAELRGAINNASPAVGEANANFEAARKLYERNQKLLGDTPKPGATNDADTIRRLRLKMENSKTQGAIERIDRDVQESLYDIGHPQAPRPAPPEAPVGREDVIDAKMSFVDRLKALRQKSLAQPPVEKVATPGVPQDVVDKLDRITRIVSDARANGLRTNVILNKAEMALYRQYEQEVNAAVKAGAPIKWLVEPEAKTLASQTPSVSAKAISLAERSAGRSIAARPAPLGTPEAPLPPPFEVTPRTDTPARDLMDSIAADAFHAPSDRLRSPSSLTLRILSALGPTAGARYGLKAGQTAVEAGRAAIPFAKVGLPPAVAAALKAMKEREKRKELP